jgi:hypothetical protein
VATIAFMTDRHATKDDPLDQGYKLHARTTAEIAERVDNFLARLNRIGLKFRKRKAKLEPFINVLVLEFFKLPAGEQEALMMREIPRFQSSLASDDGAPVVLKAPPQKGLLEDLNPPRPRREKKPG